MKLDDIVGYTFSADQYCPTCTVKQLAPSCFNPVDGTTSEEVLDVLAKKRGIDRNDERSFDSDDFPKVIFADQIDDGDHTDYCGSCGTLLADVTTLVIA